MSEAKLKIQAALGDASVDMLSDMGSIPIASTIVSTIWVAFTAWIVVIYY